MKYKSTYFYYFTKYSLYRCCIQTYQATILLKISTNCDSFHFTDLFHHFILIKLSFNSYLQKE